MNKLKMKCRKKRNHVEKRGRMVETYVQSIIFIPTFIKSKTDKIKSQESQQYKINHRK